jgi:hypothetical protein
LRVLNSNLQTPHDCYLGSNPSKFQTPPSKFQPPKFPSAAATVWEREFILIIHFKKDLNTGINTHKRSQKAKSDLNDLPPL